MRNQAVWVPFSVLNDRDHNPNTRLIWVLICYHAAESLPTTPTDEHLHQLSGLDRRTIALARARLAASRLVPCFLRPHPASASIPARLLTDTGISTRARLLYGQLQRVPDFRNDGGSYTYKVLSGLTGTSDDALRRAVAELVASGWLSVSQSSRKSPVSFRLRNTVTPRLWARIARIRRKVKGGQFRGETLLREFLNVIIALEEYQDDASPDFLLNPYTLELMEIDRFYPTVAVGFEFQGAQHYGLTDLATFDETVKQVGRDAMKAFICQARGIDLVVIRPEDLSLRALEQKIPRRLPRRDLTDMVPLVDVLEEIAQEYQERTFYERVRNRERLGRLPGRSNS